jgi:predicted aspartyl protease
MGFAMLHVLAACFWLAASQAASNPRPAVAASAKPPAISWQMTGQIVLPFEYYRQHIYVPVRLNGRPGFVFMLDSGANRNVLNLQTASRIGLRLRNVTAASQIGFGSGQVYTATEEPVLTEIGSVAVAQNLSVLDLNRFEQYFHHPTDGLLGYPFFRRFVVRLDFEHRQITLLPPEHYRYRGPGVQVPTRPSRDFVIIPATIGASRSEQHAADLLVDTGSNMTLALYRQYVKLLGLRSDLNHAQPGIGYGLNGEYPLATGRIHSFHIGMAETHNLPVDFLDRDVQLPAARNLPGAIGNSILQSFRVVIFDLPHRRMIFETPPPPWQPGVERVETPQ